MSRLINKVTAEFKARELFQDLELSIPFDLEKVLETLGIEYNEKTLDVGFDGAFVRTSGSLGIIVNSNIIYPSRKRFTIAHEIGHFYIHQDQDSFFCKQKDIDSFDKNKSPIEYEADMFAAEFLMPKENFIKDSSKISTKLSDFKTIAEKYQTSLTATSIQFIKTTEEPCALVLMENKNILWYIKSNNFGYEIHKPKDCYAYDITNTNEENIRDTLFSYNWVLNCKEEYITEDVMNFKWLNQQLVLLSL